MLSSWTPLLALGLTLLPLLGVQRGVTLMLQELSGRWTRDSDVALILYFVLVLPGVVLHELSHLLMAVVLRVRVRKVSFGPKRQAKGARVSLGSIQVGKVDPLRGSLIGVAPLFAGAAAILLIGNQVLGIDDLARAFAGRGVEGVFAGLGQVVRVRDFWVWVYLIFAISNAMLPSYSDMQQVRPVLIFLGVVSAVVLVVAGLPAIPESLVSGVSRGAGYLASAFGLTLAVDLVFAAVFGLCLWATRRVQDRR